MQPRLADRQALTLIITRQASQEGLMRWSLAIIREKREMDRRGHGTCRSPHAVDSGSMWGPGGYG